MDAVPLRLANGAVVFDTGNTIVLDALPSGASATEDSQAAAHGGVVLGYRKEGAPAAILDLCIGQLKARRMLACARCKLWWMTPEWRSSTLALPPETQFLLVELDAAAAAAQAGVPQLYALLLPLIDGSFRGTLRAGSKGSPEGSLALRIESGDDRVRAGEWRQILYVAAGSDPYQLIDTGVATAARLSGSARPRTQKRLPQSLDFFGWCTWDAFYSTVSAQGVLEGLRALRRGGICARTLIIDDGWQSTDVDPEFRKPIAPAEASSAEAVSEIVGGKTANDVPEPTESPASLGAAGTAQRWLALATDRMLGWLTGASTTLFLLYYQGIVEPAAPNTWPVKTFTYLAKGPLRPQLLAFFAQASDFTRRLVSVYANHKFSHPAAGPDEAVNEAHSEGQGLASVVATIKQQFGVDYVYCWHGLPAYWSGVMPGSPHMEQHNPRIMFGKATPGVLEVEPSMGWNPAALAGVGVIDDPNKLYNAMHTYLNACGVDGVKVDCQAGLGLVGSALGGGAAVSRRFHAALEASVSANFPGNHCINCMCHSTENLYHMANTSIARASDDFFPRDAASSHPHIAACSFNGLFISALVQPDWDMFHSKHPSAQLHGMARAICGGAVYVSDKPGEHDFELLRRLVLPDGSVLRTLQPARPTRDCLFCDVLRDDQSVLKLWSLNPYCGVLGLFHLQGSSWDRTRRKFIIHNKAPRPLTTQVLPGDVEGLLPLPPQPGQLYALYTFCRQQLTLHSRDQPLELTLTNSCSELVIVSPVMEVAGTQFAPLGLCNMFNGGGAVLSCTADERGSAVEVGVRGCGPFIAYASQAPTAAVVNGLALFFNYDADTGALRLDVPATNDLRCTLKIEFGAVQVSQ